MKNPCLKRKPNIFQQMCVCVCVPVQCERLGGIVGTIISHTPNLFAINHIVKIDHARAVTTVMGGPNHAP